MAANRDRSLVEWLGATSLFDGVEDNHLWDLSGIAMVVSCKRRANIFSAGDPGNGFYLVKEGRVKVFMLSPDGKEQILHVIGPGESFGEVAVFAGQSFPAHAVTIEKSQLLFFPRQAFILLIERYPAMAMNMLAVLSRRLRQFTIMIDALSLKEVPGRLAAYLLYLSRRQDDAETLELDITKTQLASLLGTIPETLSRMLARISSQGMVKLQGSRIVITDRQALEDLASLGKMDI